MNNYIQFGRQPVVTLFRRADIVTVQLLSTERQIVLRTATNTVHTETYRVDEVSTLPSRWAALKTQLG